MNPSAHKDVQELVVRRMFEAIEAYRSREVTILISLCELVLITPELPDQVAALARDVLAMREKT